MNMPLTGQYELVLSGWGQGNSAGCKVTMIKSFKQGETIKFFIGSFLGGVFVFDKAYQLIAVAGSAGQSQEEKIRCSGPVALSYTILFRTVFVDGHLCTVTRTDASDCRLWFWINP